MTVMSRTVTYAELCAKARALGWRVHLFVSPGGPALITGKPTRLSALRVMNGDGDELGFVYIHPKHNLDMAASLLSEEMESASA